MCHLSVNVDRADPRYLLSDNVTASSCLGDLKGERVILNPRVKEVGTADGSRPYPLLGGDDSKELSRFSNEVDVRPYAYR